jgi:RNA polymerase sigma-70 factor (ECF subfamily)
MEPSQTARSASADARSEDFEALVRPWVDEMYRAAAAIVGTADAEDVTQQALLDAWRGFARLRDQERVRPWLHSIVANRASKHLRAARSRPRLIPVTIDAEDPYARSEPDLAIEVTERAALDQAFSRLTAEQRVSLALRYSIDLTVPQIATALSIPEGTVKSRIHAAMQALRAALREPA